MKLETILILAESNTAADLAMADTLESEFAHPAAYMWEISHANHVEAERVFALWQVTATDEDNGPRTLRSPGAPAPASR